MVVAAPELTGCVAQKQRIVTAKGYKLAAQSAMLA
jgi:hypothetical protein